MLSQLNIDYIFRWIQFAVLHDPNNENLMLNVKYQSQYIPAATSVTLLFTMKKYTVNVVVAAKVTHAFAAREHSP